MLRYRDYKEHTASRSSHVWMAFATALGFVVVPILRLLCRLIPPLRRAISNTSAGRMGAAFRTRDRGDHQGAFAVAMEGLTRCRFATGRQRAEFVADLTPVAVEPATGYTSGMKTAISLPDAIFREAERLAKRLKKSRSELYREAVTEYVARHEPEAVTDALNALAKRLDTRPDAFVSAAARRVLERSEW